MIDFKKYIREGSNRCDLSLLYLDPIALEKAIERMINPFLSEYINKVVALDALGFVFGSIIAEKLHVGLVLIRKEGKIPVERISVNFIDYSNKSKSFEVAKDVIVPGENILIIDDWAETGSQIKAAISLVEKCGGIISGISCFNIDKKVKSDKELSKYKMSSVIWYNHFMLDFDFIPYNKKLVSRARELRLTQTPAEKLFWNEVLKDKTKTGYKFTRQKPLDNFIADFYCPKLLLVIEIDGGIHENLKSRDKERSEILFHKYGIKVIRYQNDNILKDTTKILLDLKKRIQSRELDLKSS